MPTRPTCVLAYPIYQKFQHVPTRTKFQADASVWYANKCWYILIGMPKLSGHSNWYAKRIGDGISHANTANVYANSLHLQIGTLQGTRWRAKSIICPPTPANLPPTPCQWLMHEYNVIAVGG